jgi:hypothetical protein
MKVREVINYLMRFPVESEFKVILNDDSVYFELCNLTNKDGSKEVYLDLDVEP